MYQGNNVIASAMLSLSYNAAPSGDLPKRHHRAGKLLSACTDRSLPQGDFGSFKIGNVPAVHLYQKRILHKTPAHELTDDSDYPVVFDLCNHLIIFTLLMFNIKQCLSKADFKSVIKTFASTTYLYPAHPLKRQKHVFYFTRHQ